MKKTVFGIISVGVMLFCMNAQAEEKTDIEMLTAILNESYGAKVTLESNGQKYTVTYPEVTIEDTELQYTEPKSPDDEPQLETKTVTSIIPATTAQCSKTEDFDSHAQYYITHNAPHKFIAQLYNRLGFSFLKDIEIKNFREELKIVPQLGLVSKQKITLDNAVYTQKDETTGLKSEIGNLQKYELLQETSKQDDKLLFRISTNMDMLNAVLPFFSLHIKSEKHISEMEYNLPKNQSFDYVHIAQNLANIISAKSAVVGHGIKIGIDMFDLAVTLDTDIKNNTRREKDETISTYGSFLLANIDIAGDLIDKEKKPKSVEIKYALKDLPPETLEELGKIQQEKSERMEKAESFNDLMAAKHASDEQFAELFDKLAEKAKLNAIIETKFDNAAITADFVLERKNGYLYGIGKVKVSNLYNIFPEQKQCAGKSEADNNSTCQPDMIFEALQDFIDTSKNDSETVYKYTEEGIFKNDVKIGEPIELDFKKMYREKQQKNKEQEEMLRKMMEEEADKESASAYNPFLAPDWWEKATPQEVETAINNGASVTERDENGMTPLMWAARFNQNPEVIETLIKHGADIKERNEYGFTPLIYAAEYNENSEVIETLIKHGANVTERDENGKTPLMMAALFNQNLEIIETLIKHGADVKERDEYGTTPLMEAAAGNQNPEVIETLIKHGADAKAKNADGKTALDYAKENEHIYRTDAYWLLNDKTYQ